MGRTMLDVRVLRTVSLYQPLPLLVDVCIEIPGVVVPHAALIRRLSTDEQVECLDDDVERPPNLDARIGSHVEHVPGGLLDDGAFLVRGSPTLVRHGGLAVLAQRFVDELVDLLVRVSITVDRGGMVVGCLISAPRDGVHEMKARVLLRGRSLKSRLSVKACDAWKFGRTSGCLAFVFDLPRAGLRLDRDVTRRGAGGVQETEGVGILGLPSGGLSGLTRVFRR